VEQIKVIAFTHNNLEVNDIGRLHIAEDMQKQRLCALKAAMQIEELLFLSTCNRVEFILVTNHFVDKNFIAELISTLYTDINPKEISLYTNFAEFFEGAEAVAHVLRVATSIDSMVVGEREIITQVRTAFEKNRTQGLTGDLIRILIRHTIETAKKVYTDTAIAKQPVSIVSLAYHRLKEVSLPLDSRILIVGAGTTNATFSKLLYKHGFRNFSFFNRTLGNAEKLAKDTGGAAYDLKHLEKYQSGFDVLITCTGAEEPIITPEIYQALLNNETDKKTIVDLAIPCDTHPEIIETQNTRFISVADLKEISEINMQRRIQEVYHVQVILDEALSAFHRMYRERQVELAMRAVPERVREIKNITKAMFAKELETLDPKSQELMERMMAVMEKKYLSVPMKMAKEIIIQQQ